MKKNPTCKRCGGLGHYSINCLRFMPQKKSKPEKKTVKITRAKAKKKAWTAFSSYIRTRDSLATTGTTTHCICITCQERGEGVKKEYKHIQAGHAVGGRGNAVLFHEEIVNGQCLTKESNIRLFNGSSKSISKLRVGDELWAFDKNTYSLEKSLVEKVNNFKPEKLYMVEMENGKIFYATDDHMLVSDGEWVSIKDILHNVSAYDILEL